MTLESCQFLAVNGIMTQASDIRGWTDLAENFWQEKGYIASRYEYTCGPWLSRWLGQEKRRRELIEVIKRQSRPIIYVGHSNGCDLFSELIKSTKISFPAVHLFAAATRCDFKANGFNTALRNGRIGKLYLYGSSSDEVLKFSWMSGLGSLGRAGPQNVDISVSDRIIKDWREGQNYGHSTWFTSRHFKETMALTMRL